MVDLALAMVPIPYTSAKFEIQSDADLDQKPEDATQPLYELVLDARSAAFSTEELAKSDHIWRSNDLFRKITQEINGNPLDLYVYETRKDDVFVLATGARFLCSTDTPN